MTREAVRTFLLMGGREDAAGDPAARPDPLASFVELARAGDREAFEQVMVCTQHRVAATAWRFLGNREDARDATQEVFLRAYKYLRGFKTGHDFHGWLYRITVNVCRDMMRERASKAAREVDIAELTAEAEASRGRAPAHDAEGQALAAQQRAIVRRALATLPLKERAAVVLRDLEGLPTEEVARLLKSRPATVRSQISTARTKIKIFCERFTRERRPEGEGL
jgi:RNA polymerase sigma-70 factor (ECF subfamily)